MGENRPAAFALVQQMRKAGIRADLDHCGRSLKAQFKYANKTGAPITAVIGDEEAANGTVKLKRMADGEEKTVAVADVCEAVKEMNS
jgi:histidyl-tRNA synthetase